MLLIIANPVIERFRLPEWLTCAAEKLVRLPGSKPLPALYDAAQRMGWHRPQDRMNVIRHDYPGVQLIALSGEEAESVGNQLGNLRPSKPALTATSIQITLQFAVVVPFNSFQSIPFGQGGTQLPGGRFLGVEPGQTFRPLCLEFKQHFPRKRVRETEGDEVSGAFPFDVRQIAARMNSRTQGICSLRFHSCGTQLETYAFKLRIGFLRKHGRRIAAFGSSAQLHRRSADFQSAVSPTCSRLRVGHGGGRRIIRSTADYKSAIQQIENLRYGRRHACPERSAQSNLKPIQIA